MLYITAVLLSVVHALMHAQGHLIALDLMLHGDVIFRTKFVTGPCSIHACALLVPA